MLLDVEMMMKRTCLCFYTVQDMTMSCSSVRKNVYLCACLVSVGFVLVCSVAVQAKVWRVVQDVGLAWLPCLGVCAVYVFVTCQDMLLFCLLFHCVMVGVMITPTIK